MKGPKPAPDIEELSAKPANLSPGMATLLKGGAPAEASLALSPPASIPEPQAPAIDDGLPAWQGLVQGSLVLADVLLVGMAAWIVYKSPGPLRVGDIAFCVLAFSLGAWTSCLALIGLPNRRPSMQTDR